MENKIYIKEFQIFDGEDIVTFDIVDVNVRGDKITVAVTRQGKITVCNYDLYTDENGQYFEYGIAGEEEHIYVNDFDDREDDLNGKQE